MSTKISLLSFLTASSMSAALRCFEDDLLGFRILLNERAVAAAADDGGGGMDDDGQEQGNMRRERSRRSTFLGFERPSSIFSDIIFVSFVNS